MTSSTRTEDELRLFSWPIEDRELIRYDARGHGDAAPADDSADCRWPALADDLLSLLDSRGIERAVVGGASMGAATTLYAAMAAPERVAAMVLAIPPTAWETRPKQARLYRIGARLVETVGVRPFVEGSRLAPSPAIFRGPLAGVPDTMLRSMRRFDREVLASVLRGAADSDLPEPDAVAKLSQPTLILAWDTDATHPVSTAEQLHELLPKSELHVATTPEAVLAWPPLVADFLASVP